MNILKDLLLNIKTLLYMSSSHYSMIFPSGKPYAVIYPALQFICLPVFSFCPKPFLFLNHLLKMPLILWVLCQLPLLLLVPPPSSSDSAFRETTFGRKHTFRGTNCNLDKKTISCTQQQWQDCFWDAALKQIEARKKYIIYVY